MIQVKLFIERLVIVSVTVVHTMFFPAFALAEGTTNCPLSSGTTAPTGSYAKTFTFNPETCLWQNQYYTWNPVTKTTTPRYSQEYVYNPSTDRYEKTVWVYSAAKNKYIANVQVKEVPKEEPASPASGNSAPSGSQSSSQSTPTGNSNLSGDVSGSGNGSSISNTGYGSANNIGSNNNFNGDLNLYNGINVQNGINAYSQSGNASVIGNTVGGSATSGNADTIANVINLLQSSWDPSNGTIATFEADIYDYHGDLMLDPSTIIYTGPNSQNNINKDSNKNLDINIQNDGRIVNNINLDSRSGDSEVLYNTEAGNATTGNATTTANIFNLMNSMISAPDLIIGTINILGKLNGDILLPYYLNSISNTGYGSLNTINHENDSQTDITSADNRNITNNTNLNAESGNADVSKNTIAGNATTGNSETNLNIYNMVGQDIVGKNGLLVFTNVLGSWNGFLFDGIGGNNSILATGPESVQAINSNSNANINIDSENNSAIENNVNLNSKSGDASVVGNTKAGDAKSGNASATANIANLINSTLNFSDSFLVLIINVVDDWFGSFGRDTEAGEKVAVKENTKSSSENQGGSNSNKKKKEIEVAGFFTAAVPKYNNGANSSGSNQNGSSNKIDSKAKSFGSLDHDSQVLASATSENPVTTLRKTTQNDPMLSLQMIGIIGGLSLIVIERYLTIKGSSKK